MSQILSCANTTTPKAKKGNQFTYRDMKPVCLIVLMEKSSSAFKAVAPRFIHREQITYDSGAKVAYLSIAPKDNTIAEKDVIIAALQEKLNKLSI